VLDHVERSHQIERAVVVRKFFTGAELHFVESTLATERECIFGNIDTLGVAVLRKHQQVRTRAATDVENSRSPIGNVAANLFDKARENAAPPDVPPVRLFHAKEDGIRVLHHLARHAFNFRTQHDSSLSRY